MDPINDDPIAWAKGLVQKQGIEDAHRIANQYRAPFLGKDSGDTNRFAAWYERAFQWLVKNAPRVVSSNN